MAYLLTKNAICWLSERKKEERTLLQIALSNFSLSSTHVTGPEKEEREQALAHFRAQVHGVAEVDADGIGMPG